MTFDLKDLNIPKEWKIHKNDFITIEPTNNLNIDDVWDYFQEDIFQANFKDFFIDLGFNGTYLKNRNGFFKLIIAKGDFGSGELYEKFLSRSTDEIKEKIEFYSELIINEKINNYQGIIYDEIDINNEFHFYSAITDTKIKLSRKELNKLSSL